MEDPNDQTTWDLGGRPTKYDPSYIGKVEEYIKTTGKEQTELPTLSGFAIYLGVSKATLNNWVKKHPDFLAALNTIMTYQEKQLIDDGIYGGKEVNATVVKLLLQNNHGMKERVDQTTNDKDIPAPIYGGKSTESDS